MRDRYLKLVMAIVTSTMFGCGDAAVEDVTAPPLAATPASPVAEEWPLTDDYENAGIPSTTSIQITLSSGFEDEWRNFVVTGRVTFTWANEVSAQVFAELRNSTGQIINQGSAGMTFRRIALPVAAGDTTFTVKLSTNNTTCGLIGKSSADGRSAQVALDLRLVQVVLYEQVLPRTYGPDVLQPACAPPPPPAECEGLVTRIKAPAGSTGGVALTTNSCTSVQSPPSGDDGTEIEVCYIVWREFWYFDPYTYIYRMYASFPIGVYCTTVAI